MENYGRSIIFFSWQDAKAKANSALKDGVEYLASKYTEITDPLQLAMTAYALEEARHREKDNAYLRLRTFNRTGQCGLMWFFEAKGQEDISE